MGDFNYDILTRVVHRPWPMPAAPWLMTQTWNDLLFAHWPVDGAPLASKLPPGVELDLFNGQAWIGIVPFRMTNVAPRFVPAIPGISAFPELNVRTYVRAGGKPGVYFFSLDADSVLAVQGARALLNLPYFEASMKVAFEGDSVAYTSRRTRTPPEAELVATYRPTGTPFEPQPGSLEYFLTERYCLYGVDHQGRSYRLEIHHPPWSLHLAHAVFTRNTMAAASGIALPASAPLLHFAKRQDMVAWAPVRLEETEGG